MATGSTFQRLAETEQEFTRILENRLNNVQALPWKSVLMPQMVTAEEAASLYTKENPTATGVLSAMEHRDSLPSKSLPEAQYKQHFSVKFGQIIQYTEDDIYEQSGLVNIQNTPIVIRRSFNRTKQMLLESAVRELSGMFYNTVAKLAGGFLKGLVSFTGINGATYTFGTNTIDGIEVSTLWTPANAATAVPFQDMQAINDALRAASGNGGRDLSYGHTILSSKIWNNLSQIDNFRNANSAANFASSNIPVEEANKLPLVVSSFGQIINQNLRYNEAGSELDAIERDHIYCTSGTQGFGGQPQPAGRLFISPADYSELTNTNREARGFTIRTREVEPRSLSEKKIYEVAVTANLSIVQYSPIYQIKVN